jgi:hypothetical protein
MRFPPPATFVSLAVWLPPAAVVFMLLSAVAAISTTRSPEALVTDTAGDVLVPVALLDARNTVVVFPPVTVMEPPATKQLVPDEKLIETVCAPDNG